jgi:hypothetical protein
VNFNHLMEAKFVKRKCSATNSECYWVPVGNIRSTQGDNVHITMICRRCSKREDIFLTLSDYKVQRHLIEREIHNACSG